MTWFRARRGLAVGTIVGSLTVGKGVPYLVNAFPQAGIATVLLTASVGAALAALLVWIGYRDEPYPFPPRPFSWRLAFDVVTERRWRLATGGYLGHMIELYSAWTWLSGACALLIDFTFGRSPWLLAPVALVWGFLDRLRRRTR